MKQRMFLSVLMNYKEHNLKLFKSNYLNFYNYIIEKK